MKDQLARNIVANLAHRYRLANRCLIKFIQQCNGNMTVAEQDFMQHLDGCRSEAWNAYVGSKRILLGLQA